jgi:hypothetical protein
MRKSSSIYGLYVLLLAIYMAGCNPPTPISYTIVNPANGSFLTAVPANFVIRYDIKPTAADIRLNGVSVRRFFTFGATEASAPGSDLQGYLAQGTNTFSVDKAGGGPSITFTLDTEGPKVTLLSVSTSEPKEILGLVSDVSGVSSLRLNGNTVNVGVDGIFETTASTANEYVFVATDTRSLTSTLRIVPEGRQFNPLVKAAVNETAIQSLGPVIAGRIRDADLKPALQKINPVFAQTWKGALNETYGMQVDIDDASFASVTLNSFNILPTDNAGLSIDADIYDVAAHMDMTVFNGLAPSYHILGWFYVDHVHFTGTIKLGVENGELKITFPDMHIELDGVVTDFDNVPDFLEHLISPLTEVLVDVFKEQISLLAKGAIESLLEEKINEMIITTNVWINPTPAEGDEIELGLDTKLEMIGTRSRNLVVGLSGGMYAISRDEGVPPVLGSEYNTGAVPDPALNQGNVTAVISANLLNQAMMVAYQVGLTHFWIFKSQLHFGSQPDDSVGITGNTRIRVAPTSPAGFKVSGNDTVVSTIELNSFDIFLDKKLASGEWAPQFQLNMNTALNIELGVDGTNRLTIGLVGTPNFYVNYVENFTALPINETQLTQTINAVLPKLAPLLGNAVGAIEIPSLGGIRLLPRAMNAVGPNHQHLSFSGDLSATP